MPTPKCFCQYPDFPSGIPVANIPVLSFKQLQDSDIDESNKLFEACQDYGFLLIDLRSSELGEMLLRDAEQMFDLTAATLNLEQQLLDQCAWNPPKDLTGYKCAGKLPTDDGKKDTMEMYTIGQDDIIGNSPQRKHPSTIESHRPGCQQFIRRAYDVVAVILSHLDKQLGLQSGSLAALSPLDEPSDTSVRLLLSHPQSVIDESRISLPGHTDIGTVTLLFNVAGGLQILPAGSENINANWRYIRPEVGCAIVNIGDTLVEWTGGLLRSSLHRVACAPGKQATVARQSVAYLIRPKKAASMRRLRGGNVVPPLSDGVEDDTRSVSEWAAWRAQQIINGVKPQTRGGRENQK